MNGRRNAYSDVQNDSSGVFVPATPKDEDQLFQKIETIIGNVAPHGVDEATPDVAAKYINALEDGLVAEINIEYEQYQVAACAGTGRAAGAESQAEYTLTHSIWRLVEAEIAASSAVVHLVAPNPPHSRSAKGTL
jgi:hypothetical protein